MGAVFGDAQGLLGLCDLGGFLGDEGDALAVFAALDADGLFWVRDISFLRSLDMVFWAMVAELWGPSIGFTPSLVCFL